MRILSLSLDPLILKKESVVASRIVRYGDAVELYTVIVPSSEKKVVSLSPRVTIYGTGGSTKLTQFWSMWKLTSGQVKKNKFDVITSQDTYFLGLLAYLVSRWYGCGFEVQVLGIEKLSFARKLLSKFVLSRADSIRVLSLGLKKRLVSEFNIPEGKMMLVPIYVDVSSLGFGKELPPALQQELTTHADAFTAKYASKFNIVSVNRLVPVKNIVMQLEAVAILKNSFPHVLLHVVGDGPLKLELEMDVLRLGIADHVILHGSKYGAELSSFFTQSDCFVLTSDFEGYGMVVIEAATAGLPIVMTDVGCAGEVIINQESGLIVPPKDIAAITSALAQMIENPAFRASVSEGAKSAIAQLPSFDTVLSKYQASWTQALINRK